MQYSLSSIWKHYQIRVYFMNGHVELEITCDLLCVFSGPNYICFVSVVAWIDLGIIV